jgi:SulP family sulfate permease
MLTVLFLGSVAAVLPISMFAGIILHVAVFGMLDKDILLWLRTPTARLDGAIALIVTLVTVFQGLMVGVALGVALAAVEFIRSQMLSAVVHRRWNLAERTSVRRRSRQARKLLAAHPDAIVGYDLKGTLFFGATDHLFTVMADDLKRARYIVLDMRRAGQVDLTAIRLIEHMSGIMRERGGELILAHIPKSMGLVRRKGHRHEHIVPYHANVRLRVFRDSDSALEYAEDRLLAELGVEETPSDTPVPLEESELLSGFAPEECEKLVPWFSRASYPAGEYLFRRGDEGAELFVILKGDVEMLLPYGGGDSRRRLRLGKFGPGMTLGEIAFLEPGPRTADARAVTDCEVAVLRHEALKGLCRKHSELGMRLLMALAHDLSQNLRRADAELRRLAS